MEFVDEVAIENSTASEARIAFLNLDLIVQAHPLLRTWRPVSSEIRGRCTCLHIELVDNIMGFDVVYQAEMIYDPQDPTGSIQFDSEAALSVKVSHTYSFRDALQAGALQPSSFPATAGAAIISDRVSVQYGWISFALKIFIDSTVRRATRAVLVNMRHIIQQHRAAAAASGLQDLTHS